LALWAAVLEGVARRTVDVGSGATLARYACTNLAASASGRAVYGLDTPDEYPAIWSGAGATPLEQPAELAGLRCAVFEWANAGTPLAGMVYEAEGTAPAAPLLVKAHGGPAGANTASRAAAAADAHLLFAGCPRPPGAAKRPSRSSAFSY
jgi:hypothetical protein